MTSPKEPRPGVDRAVVERLRAILDFLDDEAENRAAAGSEMSDYEREPRELAEDLRALIAAEAPTSRAFSSKPHPPGHQLVEVGVKFPGLPVLNRAPLRVPAERRALLAAIRCLRTIHEQAPVTTELTLAHEMAAQAGEALEEIGRFLTEDGEP